MAQCAVWTAAVLASADPIDWVAWFDLATHIVGMGGAAYGWFTFDPLLPEEPDSDVTSDSAEEQLYY